MITDEAKLLELVMKTLPPSLSPVLSFVQSAHATQKRYTESQLAHVYRCFLLMREELGIEDENMLAAILLHDAVEDQPVSLDDVEKLTNAHVRQLVDEATSATEAVDDPAFLAKISASSPEGQLVKLADRLDNCRSMSVLAAEKPHFVKAYAQKTIEFFVPLAYHRNAYLAHELEKAVAEATRRM